MLKNIVASIAGTPQHQGIIHRHIQQYYQDNPIHWAQQLDDIVDIFAPDGPLLAPDNSLVSLSDHSTSIDVKIILFSLKYCPIQCWKSLLDQQTRLQ